MNAQKKITDSLDRFVAGLLGLEGRQVQQILEGLRDETILQRWHDAEQRPNVRAAIGRQMDRGGLPATIPTLVAFARVAEATKERGVGPVLVQLAEAVDEAQRPPESRSTFSPMEQAVAVFEFGATRVCTACGDTGDLLKDFGLRRMRGAGSRVRYQPQCLKCRTKPKTRRK